MVAVTSRENALYKLDYGVVLKATRHLKGSSFIIRRIFALIDCLEGKKIVETHLFSCIVLTNLLSCS